MLELFLLRINVPHRLKHPVSSIVPLKYRSFWDPIIRLYAEHGLASRFLSGGHVTAGTVVLTLVYKQ